MLPIQVLYTPSNLIEATVWYEKKCENVGIHTSVYTAFIESDLSVVSLGRATQSCV